MTKEQWSPALMDGRMAVVVSDIRAKMEEGDHT